MKISDEMLSAFLDAELSETEMEFVRQCISEDETLANRLAELAMVDEQVAQHYKSIDARPLPTVITQLLESAPAIASTAATPFPTTSASATIIAFPLWKSIQRGIQQHAAIAACTLLVLGFGFAQLLPNKNDSLMGDWSAIASALDTTTSGTTQSLTDGKKIKPRLTFVDQQGNYCRQFLVSDSHTASENIACRINDEWRPNATIYSHDVQHADEYETATNDTEMLDNTLDLMMSGDAFDAQEESRIIRDGWKK